MSKIVANLSPAAVKLHKFIANGATTRAALAKKVRGTVAEVNGSITALKRHGIVQLDEEGTISMLIAPADVEVAANETRTPRSQSKMAKATRIFLKLHAQGKERADVVKQFVSKLDLTPAGASTYYQLLKRKAEAGELATA